jgi:hypothetical protein
MKSQRTYEIRSRAAVLIAIKMAAEEVGIDIPKGHHDVVCRDAAHFQKNDLSPNSSPKLARAMATSV